MSNMARTRPTTVLSAVLIATVLMHSGSNAQPSVPPYMDVIVGATVPTPAAAARQNVLALNTGMFKPCNVLFSVLAQFFAPDDINTRLMLIETVSFTTTPSDMLESLTRIISDRTVGQTFFGDAALMDYELMGGDVRDTIAAETKARGMATHLPPRVPFGSHQWPMLVTSGPGPTSLADLH